ncbi:MAG: hypothetical protein CENE_01496 [Candidatus Celerinatantimonas neptuna]|nr:MAG: hypothetical protein CENE_01496 [Candidatus Celerinatantimonas neptuna]
MDRLKAIEVFITIADAGSLTHAATKLGISRSMATRYLSSLV